MIDIATNIAELKSRIQQAATKNAGPGRELVLVAVSKKQPVTAIAEAYAAGQRHFGENYVQEAIAKIVELPQKSLIWHYIGPIQSNKTRAIAEHFDWVHSVDRLKVAQRLSEQRPAGVAPLNICLQVNIDNDPAKAGVAPRDCVELAQQLAALTGVRLRGLMTLPAQNPSSEQRRASFRRTRQLFEQLGTQLLGNGLVEPGQFDSLSMGMSGDFELAVEEGATMLRVGTAIFGPRSS